MSAITKRIIIWSLVVLLITTGLLLALRPQAVLVDLAEVQNRSMLVTVDEDGETRVRNRYTVSAPVTGLLLRSGLKAGDAVVAGQTTVARIQPHDPSLLDPRSAAEAQAALAAAQAARDLAVAELEEARANLNFASIEQKRARELIHNNAISKREVDEAQRSYQTSRAAVATAYAALQVREHQLSQARARLLSPADVALQRENCECVSVAAPVSGRILQQHVESEGVVQIGAPLMDLGNPDDIEVMVELLSNDAVKVNQGDRVIIDGWGGGQSLSGSVRRIEPYGYTKISALGIEEQRVKVLIDFDDASQAERLGHGYRVQVHIVLWQSDSTLAAPMTALFRVDDQWAVFIEHNGQALQRMVRTGRNDGIYTQIIDGVEQGQRVVVHPGEQVREGVRLQARG